MSIFIVYGTNNQRRIVMDAVKKSDFPYLKLKDKLKSDVGREFVPVDWQDLSRYTAQLKEAEENGKHLHIHAGDDTGHPVTRTVNGRERVLGLAWYSGRVTLDNSLERNEALAHEVFLAEAAHMVDFFYMTDEQRTAIYNAFHLDHQDVSEDTVIRDGEDQGHGHGWFDVNGYYSWVGEAFMGGFIKAYAPKVGITIGFDHKATKEVGDEIRRILTPEFFEDEVEETPTVQSVPEEEPVVEEPVQEEPVEEPADEPVEETPTTEDKPGRFFSGENHHMYHDNHNGIEPLEWFDEPPTDREPCGVCKPEGYKEHDHEGLTGHSH